MAFPSVRSIIGGSESNGTAPTYTLPATIESGDLILVIAGTDGAATHTVPTGFTEISQQNATEFQAQVFAKVADGTEDSTTVDGTLSASEAMCYISAAIQDWDGTIANIDINTIVTGTGTSADPASVTATGGSADNLFIAVAIGDYFDKIATGFPTNYTGNQTTQQHADAFGGTQAVSLATRELAAASDDPSALTLANTTNNSFAAFTIVIPPSGAATPTLTDVDGDDTVIVGDTEAASYTNFSSAIETATINTGGTASTALTVSSAGASSANLSLADMASWVGAKACPFTDANNTTQQVTVTSTNEDPDETASRPATFTPGTLTTTSTNGFTWPAPAGSILKGFASQPPANSQIMHPSGLSIDSNGIVTTDLTTDQTCYFWNATTEEGSSFQFLIESGRSFLRRRANRISVVESISNSVQKKV